MIYVLVYHGLDNQVSIVGYGDEDSLIEYVNGLKEGWHSEIHHYEIQPVEKLPTRLE